MGEDKYATEDFEALRVRAMTAILQRQPQKVSAFFIDMFYGTNFSIRHRLDILQAIRIAAAELSALDNSQNAQIARTNISSELEKPSWRKEVDQRVFANLLYTLGTVLHHSTHSPHVIKMARLLVGELCVQHLRHED